MIVQIVETFLNKYNLLRPDISIIVAFSGGYDSMCLLHIMKLLSAKYGFNLIAAHLNHAWRGIESDIEEENCRKFANDITFYSEKLSDEIPHTETAAREARYAFFEKCAKKYNSTAVLTAHNADDNAETVLYRIIHGTGITGLEGIKEHRDIYYRPLLKVYREEIENYCKLNCLTPNCDSSNLDTKYVRNKIRHEIFPLIPDIKEKLNSLSEYAKEANEIINDKLFPLQDYKTSEFIKLNYAYKCAVMHKFFRDNDIEYDRKRIESAIQFIIENANSKSGKTLSLTTDFWLFVNEDKMELVSKESKSDLNVKIDKLGVYNLGNVKFLLEKCDVLPEKFPNDNEYTAYLNFDSLDFRIRTRLDGDIISPLGMSGTQKLKKYFNGKKIPKHNRDRVILLTKGNEVLWAAGVGISERVKAKKAPCYKVELKGVL